MFLSRRLLTAIPSRNLPRMVQYSQTSRLQQSGSPPEGDDRDDDEFLFPVQLSSPHTAHRWLWSGADIDREVDLGADAFLPEKKMLHSTDNIKILNVKHKTHGDVLFTLMQDQTKLWKICNVAIFGDTLSHSNSPAAITPEKVDVALGSLLDLLNDKDQTLWRSTPALDVFSHPYQYVCPPYSIKIADNIGKLIKLAEGDRETYLPSCFKMPVLNSDEHCSKFSGDGSINIKQKTLMQSENLALVSVDIFAYDRVGMIDAVFEMLVMLEQTEGGASDDITDDNNDILSFTSDGRANVVTPVVDDVNDSTSTENLSDKHIHITSLMIGKEMRKKLQ